MVSMKNSNRCNEILVWDWQGEMGITDGARKGMPTILVTKTLT